MALNVNKQYKTGLDTSVLQEVSKEILRRASEKNNNSNVQRVNSLFQQQVELGLDLYNGKVDNQTAKQIALNNSALQIQLSDKAREAIAFLNAQAAQATNVQKNVEGKLTIAINEVIAEVKDREPVKFNSIVSVATSKDKKGSNPFYHGELLMGNNGKQEDQKEEKRNIFAA